MGNVIFLEYYDIFNSLIIRKELFHRVFDISSSYSFSAHDDSKEKFTVNCPDGLSWKQHFEVMVSYTWTVNDNTQVISFYTVAWFITCSS